MNAIRAYAYGYAYAGSYMAVSGVFLALIGLQLRALTTLGGDMRSHAPCCAGYRCGLCLAQMEHVREGHKPHYRKTLHLPAWADLAVKLLQDKDDDGEEAAAANANLPERLPSFFRSVCNTVFSHHSHDGTFQDPML